MSANVAGGGVSKSPIYKLLSFNITSTSEMTVINHSGKGRIVTAWTGYSTQATIYLKVWVDGSSVPLVLNPPGGAFSWDSTVYPYGFPSGRTNCWDRMPFEQSLVVNGWLTTNGANKINFLIEVYE